MINSLEVISCHFRLYEACGEYHKHLQKKKEYSSVEEGVTMLALDAVGAVMMSHGEEFGEDSAFGMLCLHSPLSGSYSI